MRFSFFCLIEQLVTLWFTNKNITAFIFLSIKGWTTAYIEKCLVLLTSMFQQQASQIHLKILHRGICLQECCFPWEFFVFFFFFFLSWQVRQESMLSFNVCHHTQPKNHLHFFSCPAVLLLWRYSGNTANCTAVLLFAANMLQHLNLENHWAVVYWRRWSKALRSAYLHENYFHLCSGTPSFLLGQDISLSWRTEKKQPWCTQHQRRAQYYSRMKILLCQWSPAVYIMHLSICCLRWIRFIKFWVW